MWTQLLSNRLIKQGIRINCTLPGPTQTPMMSEFESATPSSVLKAAMQPIDRLLTPEEQAGPRYSDSDAAAGQRVASWMGLMGGLATGQVETARMMRAAKERNRLRPLADRPVF